MVLVVETPLIPMLNRAEAVAVSSAETGERSYMFLVAIAAVEAEEASAVVVVIVAWAAVVVAASLQWGGLLL